jgi:hypothetical protein
VLLSASEYERMEALEDSYWEESAKTAAQSGSVSLNISRKWSTRPRETVHSTAKNGPALRGAGPPIENA